MQQLAFARPAAFAHFQWETTSAILCLCFCSNEQRGPQGFAGLLLNMLTIFVASSLCLYDLWAFNTPRPSWFLQLCFCI